jgi:hypothetical protein
MAKSDDWDRDPEARAWIKRVRESLSPKILGSAVVISMVPSDNVPNVRFAVELGFAIMYDKPLIMAIHPGQKIPDHLVRVADDIVEVDATQPEKMGEAIHAAMQRLGFGPVE